MIFLHFQGKPFNITVIQVYFPTSNAEEAEVEWFYYDLQDLLELTPKEDVPFIIGDWNAKVGSQEIPGVTGKFDLAVQNEAGQRVKGLDPMDSRDQIKQERENKLNRKKEIKQIQGIRSDRVHEEVWMEITDIIKEMVIKTIPKKK